jgi:hypothetical protein
VLEATVSWDTFQKLRLVLKFSFIIIIIIIIIMLEWLEQERWDERKM